MKSDRHVFVSLGMTGIEFRQLMTTLALAPESCPYARQLSSRLYEAEQGSDPKLMWEYEEDSPNVLLERTQCDESGCENIVDEDDERAPEGMCTPCRDKFLATHEFRGGHGPGTGWVKKGD